MCVVVGFKDFSYISTLFPLWEGKDFWEEIYFRLLSYLSSCRLTVSSFNLDCNRNCDVRLQKGKRTFLLHIFQSEANILKLTHKGLREIYNKYFKSQLLHFFGFEF